MEAADKETRAAFEKFRNEFVQQNCHRDVEMRTWDTLDIPDMGPNQSIFISTSSNKQTPFILNIGCFLALSATCLSCPLRTYLRSNTKLYTVKVSPAYPLIRGAERLKSPPKTRKIPTFPQKRQNMSKKINVGIEFLII